MEPFHWINCVLSSLSFSNETAESPCHGNRIIPSCFHIQFQSQVVFRSYQTDKKLDNYPKSAFIDIQKADLPFFCKNTEVVVGCCEVSKANTKKG